MTNNAICKTGLRHADPVFFWCAVSRGRGNPCGKLWKVGATLVVAPINPCGCQVVESWGNPCGCPNQPLWLP
jgi:hypothetical protein